MKRKAYPKYKPSGVEWLGEVPEHWGVKKAKYCFRVKAQKATTEENPIALENIESWTGRKVNTETEFDGEGIAFDSGDILFGKLRPYLAKVYLAEKAGESIGDIFVLGPSAEVVPRYGAACFRTTNYIEIIDGSTYGSKMPRASWEFIGSLPFLLPPLPEQQAIAAYLDRETNKIDSLIEKKQRLLSLLAERRAALISKAVTKGLDANAKMKSSGVEWLGEVPENWNTIRLKHLCQIRYGIGEPPEYVEDGVPLIRATNINAGKIETKNLVKVDPKDIPYNRIVWLRTGDIIVVRSGVYTGDSSIISEEFSGSIAGFDMILSCTIVFSKFIAYGLLSKYLKDGQIYLQKLRAAQPHLNAEELGECLILFPPLPEQQAIAAYLDRETAKIDALSAKVERIIERLKEYRTALISEAVTGKIDVREGEFNE